MLEVMLDFASKCVGISTVLLLFFLFLFVCILLLSRTSLLFLSMVPFLFAPIFIFGTLALKDASDERIKYIYNISEKYGKDAEIRECANRIVFYDDVVLAYGANDYALCVKTILKKRAVREIKEKLQ